MSNWKAMRDALQPPPPLDFNPWLVPAYGQFLLDVFSEFWWRGRQLTTGADRVPDACRCRTELVDTGTQYGIAHVRDPRCTIHPGELSRSPVAVRPPACICRYGVARVDGAPGPWAMFEPFGRYQGRRWGTRCFRIDPRCVHHGDRRRPYVVIVDDNPLNPAWEILDDAERRGE